VHKIRLSKPWITDSERSAVLDVLSGGWLTEGGIAAEFENALSNYTGVKHAILVPNATLGLETVIRAKVRPGGKVAVPAFTHPATALAVYNAHCNPCLCDVGLDGNASYLMVDDLSHIVDLDAIVPVSWGGNPLDPGIRDAAVESGCPLIEDCACSLGAFQSDGTMSGSTSDVSVVSFHPRKIITCGEGGAILTNSDGLAFNIRKYKSFGLYESSFGTNLKVSDINAAIGLAQLKRISVIIDYRRSLARRYDELCSDAGILWDLPCVGLGRRTYQSYCAYVPHRDRLIQDLSGIGIETQIGTYNLADLRIGHHSPQVNLSNSRLLADHLLTLPLHHEITEEDQEFVVQSITDLLRSYNG
jgi:dTDP-4-amino-4,6-dideoxygalactose transaminase